MKRTGTWIQKTIFCAMTLALAFSVIAETKQVNARVTRIKGAARYSTDSTTWQALKVGQAVSAGTVIQTAGDSFVDLVLGADAAVAIAPRITETFSVRPPPESAFQPLATPDTVRIFADSTLAIDKLTSTKTGMDEVRETQLDLRAGKIFGKARKLSPASKYEIKLPNGVAGIRGTIYTLDANGVVSVLVGSVVVSIVNPDGTVTTTVVSGGYKYDPRNPGIPPTPLTDTEVQNLTQVAQQTATGQGAEPTSYTLDQSVVHISPTIGAD